MVNHFTQLSGFFRKSRFFIRPYNNHVLTYLPITPFLKRVDTFTHLSITGAESRDGYILEKPLNFDPFGHAELSLFAKI